jgi:hypothetical protein
MKSKPTRHNKYKPIHAKPVKHGKYPNRRLNTTRKHRVKQKGGGIVDDWINFFNYILFGFFNSFSYGSSMPINEPIYFDETD